MDMNAVAKRISDSRKAKGLTQEALAAMADVSSAHIGIIERAVKVPNLATFVSIANALGVSEWYEDMLLVDPAKDDNGVAPAGVQKRIVALHKEMSKPLSFFENPAARVRTAFEKVRHMPTNVANIAGIKGEREVKTVAVETVKIEKPVRVNRFSNIEKVDVKAII